ALLQRYVAEHPVLNPLVSTHDRETHQPHNPPQTRTYFNKFLETIEVRVEKRGRFLNHQNTEVCLNREIHPPAKMVSVTGNEVIRAGVDRRREDGGIFCRKQNSGRQVAARRVRDKVHSLQQTFELAALIGVNAVSTDFIRGIRRSEQHQISHQPKPIETGARLQRCGKKDVRIQEDPQVFMHVCAGSHRRACAGSA
ncbi:MAG: hypothetical protein WBW84_09595, partial [Acidobacteriaceae bacterium]